jgi:hypothetical protein
LILAVWRGKVASPKHMMLFVNASPFIPLYHFQLFFSITAVVNTIGRIVCKTVEQGAATTCYVALHPQVTGISGKYFSNCNLETPSSQASNAELAKKLWEFSSNIVSAAKL